MKKIERMVCDEKHGSFKNAILEVACSGDSVAFDKEKNEVVRCSDLDCSRCLFDDDYVMDCNVKIAAWCRDEYVEPKVDWTKIPLDTPVLVKDCETGSWKRRYFAGYDKDLDIVRVWISGMTSWTANCNPSDIHGYKYAKLDISALCIDKNVGANVHE